MDFATSSDAAPPRTFSDAGVVSGDLAIETNTADDSEAWRREVAARLERYRARRKPRAPRYPSLFLPFDAPESRTRSIAATDAFEINPDVAPPPAYPEEERLVVARVPEPPQAGIDSFDLTTNLIEFPRSAAIPVFGGPELADPVLDRPRILEAPEIVPPPPALGGILIEPAAPREADKNQATEAHISPATIPQRLAASLIDGSILGAALAGSAVIFMRLNPQRLPLSIAAGSLGGAAVLLWCAYQYAFVVHTGSTPGLRALKLGLVSFDGMPVPRGRRRLRVLTSFLSGFSLGLGYLWSILDEEGLCWHDRITRTLLQLQAPPQ